jgi:MFS family permease
MNAAAMSTFRMMGDAGYVIGPLALGLIVDLYGPISALLLAATLLVLVGAAFAFVAPETYRGRRRRTTAPERPPAASPPQRLLLPATVLGQCAVRSS